MQKPKAGRPRIHDYNQIIRLYRRYMSKRKVALELGIDRRVVQHALEVNTKFLLSKGGDNHIVKSGNMVKSQ